MLESQAMSQFFPGASFSAFFLRPRTVYARVIYLVSFSLFISRSFGRTFPVSPGQNFSIFSLAPSWFFLLRLKTYLFFLPEVRKRRRQRGVEKTRRRRLRSLLEKEMILFSFSFTFFLKTTLSINLWALFLFLTFQKAHIDRYIDRPKYRKVDLSFQQESLDRRVSLEVLTDFLGSSPLSFHWLLYSGFIYLGANCEPAMHFRRWCELHKKTFSVM